MFCGSCMSRVRSTKGFCFLLTLGLFIHTTVAIYREISGGFEFSERINMTSDDMNEDQRKSDEYFNVKTRHGRSSAPSTARQTSNVSFTMTTATASASALASGSPGTPLHNDSVLEHADHSYFVQNLINGIAQDLYLHPTKMNFYESKWQAPLETWAEGAEDRTLDRRTSKIVA